MIDPWIWLGACIFLAYTLEAMTGFGSVVIALSLGALMLPIKDMLPVLVALNVLMSGFLTWKLRGLIDRSLLLSLILPGMLVGTLLGFGLSPWLSDGALKQGFGVLIMWFALRELLRMGQSKPAGHTPLWMTRLQIGAAGISHGLFASGGPLLVYALAATELDKARFRATLVCVWLSLNSVLTLAFLANGSLAPALPHIASYVPLLAVGVLLGERLHHRVPEQHFRIGIYVLLSITGALLAWRA
ncbi:sulfite exporter TauE/SafE family protein [Pseudomonas sp. LS44]|uniref:sulfite exporter TauE/SafE family protein n=1 Tax=Pseudomonas sp. LS44 TaxID=1357074 RepID=UPI00215A54B1|nr:sulfite exporter TauE/SafE family protein [Pseudomonas sp. LS44]UVE16207.1 sulfite exporter TauE/SafE family protein [Pseudomonas sp. LS44]